MTDIHFEDLWEKCEQFHQTNSADTSMELLTEELSMKINLYKVIDAKTELSEEDRQKAKSRTLGEILLTLTHMSLQDNINVFESLQTALHYRDVSYFSQKNYSTT